MTDVPSISVLSDCETFWDKSSLMASPSYSWLVSLLSIDLDGEMFLYCYVVFKGLSASLSLNINKAKCVRRWVNGWKGKIKWIVILTHLGLSWTYVPCKPFPLVWSYAGYWWTVALLLVLFQPQSSLGKRQKHTLLRHRSSILSAEPSEIWELPWIDSTRSQPLVDPRVSYPA